MKKTLFDLARKRIVLLDGAMGTELMRRGLPSGCCPEKWNLDRPDVVQAVHRDYFQAGADAVSTNSFGGSRIKLASHGLEGRSYELNLEAARLARASAPAGKYVLGSIGPTGKFLRPQGEFEESEFEDAFAEQARALAEGGADALLIETQYDLREALCALRAARRTVDIPAAVTLTFSRVPRGFFTLMGDGVSRSLQTLEKAGLAALGANCTLHSGEMVELVKVMRETTSLPLIAQANAGKPSIGTDSEIVYSQSLEEYTSYVPALIAAGVDILGGCCGTTPATIARMAEMLSTTKRS